MEFDHNSFSVGWLNLGVEHKGKRTEVLAELAFGPRAQAFFGGGSAPLGYIRNLHLNWLVSDNLKATFGAFQPFYSFEDDPPFYNTHFTGSYAYAYLPPNMFAGVQLEYVFDENWSALLGLYNSGLDVYENNRAKHIGGQLTYAKDRINRISLGSTIGNEAEGALSYRQFIFEWIGDFQCTSQLKLGTNFLYVNNDFQEADAAQWYSAVLYGRYDFAKTYDIGLRAEYVNDLDASVFSQSVGVTSFTASVSKVIDALRLTAEFRFDQGNKEVFVDDVLRLQKTDGHFLLGASYGF